MISRKYIAATAVAAGLAVPAIANHSWSNYHWQRTGNEVTVPVYDSTTGTWPARVAEAVADWNGSDVIESPLSRGSSDPSCPIVSGQINVCNDDYGDTGWLGIASITVSRGRTGHIGGGVTKLNDYFFNQTDYDSYSWRQLVTCQEIGHDYGLGHQDENFQTDNTTSCMDYTNKPAGNESPDGHDFDQLLSIYAHNDTDGTTSGPGKGGGKKLGLPGNTPAEWGTPIGHDAKGRANLYKRAMAGYDIITHVTWAPGEGEVDGHEHGPRTHSGDHHFGDEHNQ